MALRFVVHRKVGYEKTFLRVFMIKTEILEKNYKESLRMKKFISFHISIFSFSSGTVLRMLFF